LKQLNLEKLLKEKTLAALLVDLEALVGQGVVFGLCDAQGQPLAGPATLAAEELGAALDPGLSNGTSRALTVQGELAGFLVAASPCPAPQLDAAADLLTYQIIQALENRALAQEILERYREINLLYDIQKVIGAPLDSNQIANLVVTESIRVIKATAGALLLLTPNQLAFEVHARQGQTPVEKRCSHADTIAGWVVRNRSAVIVNDVSSDPRCGPADAQARSLLCVPLTIGNENAGALVLYDKVGSGRSSTTDNIFTASDQKLITALASQAAIAIKAAREVEARENRLKAQIRKLRIEIDEIRKKKHVTSITTTDYFAYLQKSAQEMRREFEEGR
jgi:putative methionine-R-sulfoxide reductase with GAF domain